MTKPEVLIEGMKKVVTQYFILAAIILISIIGGTVAVYSTANGPWGYTDSVEYISTARSLLDGRGLGYYQGNGNFDYVTIHPPFYSLVLSAIGLLGINLVVAARWLNVISFVLVIFITGWMFFRFSRVPAMGIIASALMCAFPGMVSMFSSSMSEPLFIFLVLLQGLCLLVYLEKKKSYLLALTALAVGLASLNRSAGLAMLGAGAVSILLFAPGQKWQRPGKVFLYTGLGSLPAVLWFAWVYISVDHSIGGRSIDGWTVALASHFQAFRGIFVETIWKWIPYAVQLPLYYRARFGLLGISVIVVAGLSFLAWRWLRMDSVPNDRRYDAPIFVHFGLSALFYVVILIATYLFTLPTIDINNRILLPLYVSSVIALFGAFALWQMAWFRGRLWWLQILPWLIGTLCVYWYIPQVQKLAMFYHTGDGLTAYRWDHSETINAVRSLPSDKPVISNDWELLLLWTDRPIYGLWLTFPTGSPQEVRYGANSADPAQMVFCEQGAALVVFDDFSSQVRTQIGESYLDRLPTLFAGLSVFGKYPDGTIYLCPAAP